MLEIGSSLQLYVYVCSKNRTFLKNNTSSCTTVNAVSINSVLQQNLHVFPNPSNGIFIVENEHIGQNYAVTDIYGREIEQGRVKQTYMQLQLTQYADGIYFLKL